MATISEPRGRIASLARPRIPQRTLSSSLRMYSSPLIPRLQSRSKTLPANPKLSATPEEGETQPLLGGSPTKTTPPLSIEHGSSNEAERNDAAADDDDVDIEAEQSDEQADSDGLYPPNCCWTTDRSEPPKRSDPYGNRKCDVYGNIHRIRQEIIHSIDDPYSLEQLKAPRMNISVVRPLVDKFYSLQDLSIVYCLLVNRAQFVREQSYAAHHQTVNLTRALLCELVAEKVLRRYNELNPGPRGLLKLANILVAGFEPFQGAMEDVVNNSRHATHQKNQRAAGRYHHHQLTALEVAIVSESKSFLASTACQKVVDAIYRGKVVYSPSTYIDIIPDHWKRRPISLYDPRRAPILNQYRLVVPRTRNIIEVVQFLILLALYITVMAGRENRQTTTFYFTEAAFEIYAFGWILDQLASILEHGWQVYTQNLWSFLDVMFAAIFMVYFGVRMRGLGHTDHARSEELATQALDILSCAAPVLIPRLAFNIMSENMLFLSLRAMMGDFMTLSALAIWCFGGFLLSLKWLHNGLHEAFTISKWMIFVWFGLDGTGINESPNFHPFFGPLLFILFAFLGNTLFLTILVSMLSNTFSLISANAIQEIQYRRSVLTFLGVKSDSLFAFMPPFNLLAFFIFAPLKWLLTPRMFHTVNVFAVRVINMPTLVLLSWYERRNLWVSSQLRHNRPKRIDWNHRGGPRVVAVDWLAQTLQLWDFSKFSAHGDIQAVFETEPPEDILHRALETTDDETSHRPPNGTTNTTPPKPSILGNRLKKGVHAQFKTPFLTSHPSVFTSDDSCSGSPIGTPNKGLSTPKSKSPSAAASTRSTQSKTQHQPTHKRARLNSTTDVALRKEFHDSEDEQEAASRRKSRADFLSRKSKRKDSLIDYTEDMSLIEANVRLKQLENRLTRIEELLIRVASVNEAMGSELGVDVEAVEAQAVEDKKDEEAEDADADADADDDDDGEKSMSDAEIEEAVRGDIDREESLGHPLGGH